MNDDLKYQVTNRLPWFREVKELDGSKYLYAFAVGVITAIIDDPYHTADQALQEIRGTLSDLKKVWSDGSLSNGYRHKKTLRANGESREN